MMILGFIATVLEAILGHWLRSNMVLAPGIRPLLFDENPLSIIFLSILSVGMIISGLILIFYSSTITGVIILLVLFIVGFLPGLLFGNRI